MSTNAQEKTAPKKQKKTKKDVTSTTTHVVALADVPRFLDQNPVRYFRRLASVADGLENIIQFRDFLPCAITDFSGLKDGQVVYQRYFCCSGSGLDADGKNVPYGCTPDTGKNMRSGGACFARMKMHVYFDASRQQAFARFIETNEHGPNFSVPTTLPERTENRDRLSAALLNERLGLSGVAPKNLAKRKRATHRARNDEKEEDQEEVNEEDKEYKEVEELQENDEEVEDNEDEEEKQNEQEDRKESAKEEEEEGTRECSDALAIVKRRKTQSIEHEKNSSSDDGSDFACWFEKNDKRSVDEIDDDESSSLPFCGKKCDSDSIAVKNRFIIESESAPRAPASYSLAIGLRGYIVFSARDFLTKNRFDQLERLCSEHPTVIAKKVEKRTRDIYNMTQNVEMMQFAKQLDDYLKPITSRLLEQPSHIGKTRGTVTLVNAARNQKLDQRWHRDTEDYMVFFF